MGLEVLPLHPEGLCYCRVDDLAVHDVHAQGQGRIVEVAETASLVDRGLRHASVRFKEPVDSRVLDDLPGVQVISRDAGLHVSLQIEGEMDELIKVLGSFPVSYLDTARPSLEEVFLAYYETGQDEKEEL